MNRQQLLSRLARRDWPVVYSTGAMSVWDRGTSGWRDAAWRARQEQAAGGVRVDHPGRLPLRWEKYPAIDRFAIRRYARGLLRRSARFGSGDSIAYVFRPGFLPYAQALNPRYLVYHVHDMYSLVPEWNGRLAAMEREIVARADLIVGVTPQMLARLPDGGTAPRYVLPNGADSTSFAAGAEAMCPTDLAAIPGPRIGYVGVINRKVDFALVAAIAGQRPDWHWIFIGPVQQGAGAPDADAPNRPGFSVCKALPNVHFLGQKSYQQLPAYMAHMDVNTMCYRESGGWWTAGYPLKLHEYLAVGRPIVSVPREELRQLRHVISLASGAREWSEAIENALAGRSVGTREERRAVAFANSWSKRADQLDIWLKDMIRRSPNSERNNETLLGDVLSGPYRSVG